MRVLKALGASLLISALTLSVAAVPIPAQTPDALPPASEGVCEMLQGPGITPGLYGLCVAFCEALDCDPQQLFAPDPKAACKPPSRKILDRYNALKGAADPAMPCVQQAACPCWSAAEIGAIGLTWSDAQIGYTLWASSDLIFFYSLWEIEPLTAGHQARVISEPSGQQCAYTYLYYNRTQTTPPDVVRFQDVSPWQAEACKAQIVQQADNLCSQGVAVKDSTGRNVCQ